MPYGTSGAVAWRRGWDGWRCVMSGGRARRLVRASRADIAWVVFVGLNLAAMQLAPVWQTVPFLCIWVSLTAVYGFRLWRLGAGLLTVVTGTFAAGGAVGREVRRAELIERAATAQGIAAAARVGGEELLRMRRLTSRLLLLAATDGPDFVRLAPVDVADLVAETLRRWAQTPRRWSVGTLTGPGVLGDWDRLTLALDALIENAVDHTDAGAGIELSARREGGSVVLTVADSGPGIPAAEVSRIFSRFSRIDAGRNRATGGFGLGLAIVKAIAEAHHGSVQVRSTVGQGSAFELHLPAHTPDATPVAVGGPGQPLDHQAIPR